MPVRSLLLRLNTHLHAPASRVCSSTTVHTGHLTTPNTSTTSCSQYASGAAVVAEYLRALVITGKLADYASTAPPDRGEDHRSMSQLLREMQTQVGRWGCRWLRGVVGRQTRRLLQLQITGNTT
eukprot:957287-Pelagomonas_calceolata.AAC.2